MKKEIKKGELHPNNPHKGRYDFKILIEKLPELKSFIIKNPIGEDTIDFSDNQAVICLNKALIKTYYNIDNWDIPAGFLCPPIPGRADYIHYIADLLTKKKNINVLDIGTGANCIYPIIGSQTFSWNYTASDIDPKSIENAQKIIDSNENLKNKVKLKLQKDRNHIFLGVIEKNDRFDLTMCNPPFHSSLEDALKANQRKVDNLNKGNKNIQKGLNFGGQKAELWCPGGERLFLKKMAKESAIFASQVYYFTSLISNKENVKPTIKVLEKLGAKCQVLEMSQGQKISRVLAWTFNQK
ncbi:23S rRNA (adenine(1618)-N(6))-methyltransferase RlmF (plasmid) [Cetobacterium somerae]|uniref:23S rRNA (adenine(1618)-N(6))-methyltransferase RlmF n=1 Tax=Cetobacterium somerae TaxID=188913 RepID=UPI001F05BA2C|nr:23S rRNA (adenine(1618)-N(6))-methyltransferase RlmF [Cetobacterium somerae]UPO98838.1 23S rRNA (adenine(1618)-N(6))-methyltransferase RlmF [Cetobacterium somerae]